MMTLKELKHSLGENYSDMWFTYHGKPCGVTSTVQNYRPTFEAWCGEQEKTYHSLDDLISDTFFDGTSLVTLLRDKVQFYF